MKDWPTKKKDLKLAQFFIQRYASTHDMDERIGIFEVKVNTFKKTMNIQLSQWVIEMTAYFIHQYGAVKGETIARRILSMQFIAGQSVH
ncbi:MAG: hypothetical protein EBQ95_08395 [Gammaproteobacteria bacterium]|nr:hypothetical protein [Gammaproteobacteria bacterium]